jgi:uncharacterized Ntn-hydrolase superfamily protein
MAVTFSIVARDRATGDLGVAVQSRFLAVGSVVPWARAGVGAIATQSYANVRFGPDGLALLEGGDTAERTLAALVEADGMREERQAGIVDARGRAATFTGRSCFAWAGGRTGPDYAAQGNILAGSSVVDGMADTFEAGGRPFPELLVACLAAADAAGGDRRGRQSAALLIVRDGGGYGGGNDRWIDLRVDDHPDPIAELGRLLDLTHLYLERPAASELIAVDAALAGELRAALERLGWGPDTTGEPVTTRGLGRRLAGALPRLDGRREPRGANGSARLDRPAGPGLSSRRRTAGRRLWRLSLAADRRVRRSGRSPHGLPPWPHVPRGACALHRGTPA